MKKRSCICCGKELPGLYGYTKINDGIVCFSCLNAAGYSGALIGKKGINLDQVKRATEERKVEVELKKEFIQTQSAGDYIQFDDIHNFAIVGKGDHERLFRYENILNFDLLENDSVSVSSGGIGRAAVGGALFGSTGAIVGGVTGKKKTIGKCTSLKLKITLKNTCRPVLYIPFIQAETKKNGVVYNAAMEAAQVCMSMLQLACDKVNQPIQGQSVAAPVSAADEIMKFKNLLDAGIITQEEFNVKKKQLLGL